jgi:hypothetical protein
MMHTGFWHPAGQNCVMVDLMYLTGDVTGGPTPHGSPNRVDKALSARQSGARTVMQSPSEKGK